MQPTAARGEGGRAPVAAPSTEPAVERASVKPAGPADTRIKKSAKQKSVAALMLKWIPRVIKQVVKTVVCSPFQRMPSRPAVKASPERNSWPAGDEAEMAMRPLSFSRALVEPAPQVATTSCGAPGKKR